MKRNAGIYYDASHVRNYNESGIDVTELLPDTHDEVKAYKYFMKAGSVLAPELFANKYVLLLFDGKGDGILTDAEAEHRLNTVCFYAPNFNKVSYSIYAITDIAFVKVVANQDSHDRAVTGEYAVHLPFYRKESQCDRYDQDCKTPGTISRTVLYGEFDRLGRLTCGMCKGGNCGGTIEKGHGEVHQWNYALGNSDYQMKVGTGDEAVVYDRKAGDWDFIPAGLDHSLYAGTGKEVYYVWVEFNTYKKGE